MTWEKLCLASLEYRSAACVQALQPVVGVRPRLLVPTSFAVERQLLCAQCELWFMEPELIYFTAVPSRQPPTSPSAQLEAWLGASHGESGNGRAWKPRSLWASGAEPLDQGWSRALQRALNWH